MLPPELLRKILILAADVPILVSLNVFSLRAHGKLLSLNDCERLAIACTATQVVTIFRAGFRPAAEDIITFHIDKCLTTLNVDVRTNDEYDHVLDCAVEHGSSNRFIVKMLRAKWAGHNPLAAAAKRRRFDTVRALFYNDLYGECWMRIEVRDAAIEADHLPTVKWIFTRCHDFMASYAFGGRNLVTWICNAIRCDAVNVFAYIHDNHLKGCSRHFANLAVKNKSVRILTWMITGCTAIRTETLKLARKYQTAAYKSHMRRRHRDTPWDSCVIDILESHVGALTINDDLRYCAHRPWINHYDDLATYSDWRSENDYHDILYLYWTEGL